MKYELQNIISGKSQIIHGTIIQAIASYLERSQRTSEVDKESKLFREQETAYLRKYITTNNLWILDINI